MGLDSPATLERKHNSFWTREQRLIEAVRHMQRTGQALGASDTTELLSILTAVDDYAKGTTTTMDTIKTNYTTWKTK